MLYSELIKLRKIELFVSLVFSGILFVSINPFFTWSSQLIFLFLILLFLSCTFLCKIFVSNLPLGVFVLFLMYAIYFLFTFFPFREYDTLKLGIVTIAFSFFIFFINKNILLAALNYLYWIFSFVAFVSVFSWFLYLASVPFPNIEVAQNFRNNVNAVYHMYFGVVILNSQYIQLPGGLEIFRNSAWFGEASHYGIYASLMLVLFKERVSSYSYKCIVFSILITFSASAYICLLVIYISVAKVRASHIFGTLFLLSVCIMFFITDSGAAILDRYLVAKFQGDSFLDDRTQFYGPEISDLGTYKFLFGAGFDYINKNDWVLSDFRAIIYKFGFLSIILFSLILFSSVIGSKSRNGRTIYFVLMLIIIVSHRSWMILGFYWTALLVASMYLDLNKFGVLNERTKDIQLL